MYMDIQYNDERFTGMTIKPEETESSDHLHNQSLQLMVRNPAIRFTEMAKDGYFNEMCDEDYDIALRNIKLVSSFFNNQPDANIFHVLSEAINYILSHQEGA